MGVMSQWRSAFRILPYAILKVVEALTLSWSDG